jgi:hypothetical protein
LAYSANRAVWLALLVLLASLPARGAGKNSVELLLGGALNASTPLEVEQEGQDDIEITADYSTKPFEFPVYYTLRYTRAVARGAWEIQFTHHKIHLENTTDEIERFEITDGFNIFALNRSLPIGPVDLRAGAGVVITHADSRIRGAGTSGGGMFDTGYELGGPALLAGAGRRFRLSDRWTGMVDAQATVGWARVSVADGEARTTNVALHLMVGVGYAW